MRLCSRLSATVVRAVIHPAEQHMAWAALAVWCLLITILSSIPGNRYPDIDLPSGDKVVHALLYFGVGWLAGRAMRNSSAPPLFPASADRRAITFGCLFGLLDELHQWFVPFRNCSIADLAVDAVGVTAGVAAWFVFLRVAAAHRPVWMPEFIEPTD